MSRSVAKIVGRGVGPRYTPGSGASHPFLGERRALAKPSHLERRSIHATLSSSLESVFPRPTDFIQARSTFHFNCQHLGLFLDRYPKTADATNSKHLCKRRPSSRTADLRLAYTHSGEHNCATMTMKICP